MKITEKAAEQVKQISENEGLPLSIRAGVKGGGCSGFQYALFFEGEDDITEMDNVYESHGVKIIVDNMSHAYIKDTEIDFVQDDLIGGGFKFLNPHVKASCGCGMSFSA